MNYVPILKVRPGEMSALHETPRESLQPLLELMPMPSPKLTNLNLDEDQEAKSEKTLAEHLLSQLKLISTKWGSAPVMVDFKHLLAVHSGAVSHLRSWADDAYSEGVRLIPVVPLNASAVHTTLALYIIKQHHNGCALRVEGVPDDWVDTATSAQVIIDLLDISKEEIDLVVDLGDVHRLSVINLATSASLKLPQLLSLGPWRSTTLASGGFPNPNPTMDDSLIPRVDIQVWRQLMKLLPNSALQFGDYGVDNPKFGLAPINTLHVLLKYTLDDTWWFLRERGMRGAGKPEGGYYPGKKGDFRSLCKKLIADPRFMTISFSWGDQWLYGRVSAINAGGGAERRQAMLSHHFMVVLNEVCGSSYVPALPTMPADDELPF